MKIQDQRMDEIPCDCYCPRWHAFERCSPFDWLHLCQVAAGLGEGDARDESAPAQTSPQQAGFGSDRPSACWRSVLVVVFVRQMSPKFHRAQIFVIMKFHVTNINNNYKCPVVFPLLYIVPSVKRFVGHYSGQPARKGNSMKLIIS